MPEPLHPALVHLPLGLAMVLPLFAVGALIVGRRSSARTAWIGAAALFAFTAVGAWIAVETGEKEEDVVEPVVGESALHEHEEAAETFHLVAWASLVLAAAGLVPGRMGGLARTLATVAAFVLLASALNAGKLGGALVWEHGAADAYRGGEVSSPSADE